MAMGRKRKEENKMIDFKSIDSLELVSLIKTKKIGVFPTDTIYGIHGLALDKSVVERIYKVRKRTPTKPFIILISSISQINLFGINLDPQQKVILETVWPNQASVVLSCEKLEFKYLHRGTNSLAFRLPNYPELTNLINQTGPLISTSVNPEGLVPALTINEAKTYFEDDLDYYVDIGKLESQPSTLISLVNKKVEILRQGTYQLPNTLRKM